MTTGIYIIAIVAAAVFVLYISVTRRRRGRASVEQEKDAAYALTLGCLIEGKRDEALKHLREAIRLNPENVHAYIKLGDMLREKGDVERALQIHRELTVRRGTDASAQRELYRSLAKDYILARRFADAKAAAEKLLSYNKKNEQALEIMARAFEGTGELDKAFEVQEELVRHKKGAGEGFLALYKSYMGTVHLDRGDLPKARKSFENALHIDGDCLPALLHLGDIHYTDGDRKKAIERWVALTSKFPQWAFIVYGRLERAYYESGAFGDVERVYEDVLRARPADIPTLLAMAEINQKRRVFDEAMRLVKEALEIDPSCRRARQLLVRLHLEKDEPEDALKDVMTFLKESRPDEAEFVCSDCGYKSKEVLFRCPDCRKWNTFLT